LRRNVEQHLAASAVEGLQSGQFIEPKLHGPAAERAPRARSINVHAPSRKVVIVNRW